ncbi:hypothetical protein QOT17_015337 [Balamuthia mandrillaris]
MRELVLLSEQINFYYYYSLLNSSSTRNSSELPIHANDTYHTMVSLCNDVHICDPPPQSFAFILACLRVTPQYCSSKILYHIKGQKEEKTKNKAKLDTESSEAALACLLKRKAELSLVIAQEVLSWDSKW